MLLIIHEDPFGDSQFVRQLVNQYGVKESEVTLHRVDNKCREKIEEVGPRLVWVIGNEVKNRVKIDMPFKVGFGRCTPIYDGNHLAMMIPSKKMVSTMPQKIKMEFCARMEEFKKDWKNKRLSINNRADIRQIRSFAKAYGFEEDTKLKADKSYWVMYSKALERHIITVSKKEYKELWATKVPFGILVSNKEMQGFSKKDTNFILKVLGMFGGDIVKRVEA